MQFCIRFFIVFNLLTFIPAFAMHLKGFAKNLSKPKGNFTKNIGKIGYYSRKFGSLSDKNFFKTFTIDSGIGLSKASISSPRINFGKIQKGLNYSTKKEELSIDEVQNKVDTYLDRITKLYDEIIKNKERYYNELASLRENNYSDVDLALLSQKINNALASTHEKQNCDSISSELNLILFNYPLPMDYIEKKLIPFQQSGPVYEKAFQDLDEKIIKEATIVKNILLIVEPLVKAHFGTLLMKAVGEKILKDTVSFVVDHKNIDILPIITNKVNFCKESINTIVEKNQDFISYSNAFYEKKYNELEQKTMTLEAFKNIAHSSIKNYINSYVKNRSEEFVDKLKFLINERLNDGKMSLLEGLKKKTKRTVNTLNVQRASVWKKTKKNVKDFFKNMFNNK